MWPGVARGPYTRPGLHPKSARYGPLKLLTFKNSGSPASTVTLPAPTKVETASATHGARKVLFMTVKDCSQVEGGRLTRTARKGATAYFVVAPYFRTHRPGRRDFRRRLCVIEVNVRSTKRPAFFVNRDRMRTRTIRSVFPVVKPPQTPRENIFNPLYISRADFIKRLL